MGWIAEHKKLFIGLCVAGGLIVVGGIVVLLLTMGVFSRGLKVRLLVVKKAHKRQVGGTNADRSGFSIDQLEYALTGVSMAESAELSGTSFNNPKNVIRSELQAKQFDFEAVHYAAAHSDKSIEWLDLMDKAAVDKKMAAVEMKPPVGSVAGGNPFAQSYTFRFMSVEYLRPIKLKASVELPDGSVMYTRESADKTTEVSLGDSKGAHGESHSVWGVRYDGSFVAEKSEGVTADLSTIVMTNSVSWIQLPEPGITVTSEDLKSSHLALIYDPYLNLRAYARSKGEDAQVNDQAQIADAFGNEWAVPVMSNTPVLVPKGDSVVRDVYVLSPASKTYDILLVLYYLKNAPTVLRGANTSVVSRGTEVFPIDERTMLPQVMEMKVNSDNEWSFLGVTEVSAKTRTAFISGFKRAESGVCTAHAVSTSQGTWGIDLGGESVDVPYVRSIEAEAI